MKRIINLIILTLLFFFTLPSISQSEFDYYNALGAYLYLNENYEEYLAVGEMKNDHKNGKWLDISKKDSTVYRISYFDDGYPTGEWTVFYPDGITKRKSLRYDLEYKPVEWRKYWRDILIISISKPEGFSQVELSVFEKQEELLFITELNEFFLTYNTTNENHFQKVKYYHEVYSYMDVDKATESYCRVTEINSFSYKLKLFHQSGFIRREINFVDGLQKSRISFLYTSSDKLKRKDYYQDEILTKTEYIDKKGDVKKEKFY